MGYPRLNPPEIPIELYMIKLQAIYVHFSVSVAWWWLIFLEALRIIIGDLIADAEDFSSPLSGALK